MNRILCCDWLPKRARWSYLARSGYGLGLGFGFVPQVHRLCFRVFFTYNKSFIDQACSIKMAGYWPHSFFACLWTKTKFMDRDKGQYPAILTSHLVNNPYCIFEVNSDWYQVCLHGAKTVLNEWSKLRTKDIVTQLL